MHQFGFDSNQLSGVIKLRLDAQNQIENVKCACASPLFLFGRLQAFTTNQIHFEHDQILQTVSRNSRLNFL